MPLFVSRLHPLPIPYCFAYIIRSIPTLGSYFYNYIGSRIFGFRFVAMVVCNSATNLSKLGFPVDPLYGTCRIPNLSFKHPGGRSDYTTYWRNEVN